MALTQEGSVDNIDWMNFVWFAGNGVLTLFAYPLIFAFEKPSLWYLICHY